MSSSRRLVMGGVLGAFLAGQGGAQAQPAPDPQPPAQPQGAQPQPPSQPPAPTRATFVSTTSEAWDVAVDGQPVCATPCTLQLHPIQFVSFRSQEAHAVVLDVGRLPPGDLVVSGEPLNDGMYAGGIVATTLGGMAAVVGITLTAIGLAKDRSGMTTAGLITGAAGAVALPGGIYLMMNAVPRVSVVAAGVGGRF